MFDMVSKEQALVGREDMILLPEKHFVNHNNLNAPYPENLQQAMFGLGCFWGAEKKFWDQKGVFITLVGYAAGYTKNPTYQEVCSGMTGHNEVVFVVFDPSIVTYENLLVLFWESHNPTQGMQQGNDRGTQYRSGIYTYNEDQDNLAQKTREQYQIQVSEAGLDAITTEIKPADTCYAAEEYHQQYLAKNPAGYCGLGGTGIKFK
ncbi:MAG: peptide-methionine (S)-S-oxide reductase MsrA [Woeseiaceae bacterium]